MNIVVYGTLKRDYWNNRLLQNATYQGDVVVDGYCLYDGGFPVAQPMEGASLQGELWYIDDEDRATVANCDRLEGTPNFYSREPVEAKFLHGQVVEANMYVGTVGSFTDLKTTGNRPPCRLNENGHHYWEGRR
jgi:gamma-glutamylcyclotransferase (GGCT)/AIG2-like uncharacterized protein YtfP